MATESFWYRIYGCVLESDIAYPHLIETDDRQADIEIRQSKLERAIADKTGCHVDPVTKERIYFCNQVGSFLITGGKKIEICPNPGVDVSVLTPFVFGYCIAMLFWQRGVTAVHCSAVERDGKAIIISGYSGSGKSTITTKLIENGYRLMTDDVAMIAQNEQGGITVYPAFPQQKLCRDAVERNRMDTKDLIYIDEDRDKYAIPRREVFCEDPCELVGILCLDVQQIPELQFGKVPGAQCLTRFMENLFLFPMFRANNVFTPQDMLWCINVVQQVPVYGMIRPAGIDCTKEQLAAVNREFFGEA